MRFQLNLIPILLAITSSIQASEYQPYVTIQSIAYSNSIAIKAIADDWQPPFYGGDTALIYGKIESGVHWQEWQLGILERCDYFLEFAPQTAEFFYLTKNKLPLAPGKKYEIYINALHNCSQGIKLGRMKQLSSTLRANLAVSYLQSDALTDGSLKGSALVAAEKSYDFQFDVDYLYSRDTLFKRRIDTPKGKGYTVDLRLDWQPSKEFSSQLEIIDLTSRVYWNEAPYTIATATSDTKTYDEDGYLHYDPAISGYESYKRFVQTLPRKLSLAAQYRWTDNFEALAEYQDFEIEHFTSIGAGWWPGDGHHLQGLYNITAKAVVLRYMWKQLHLELGGDKTKINQVRYFVFQLSYSHSF